MRGFEVSADCALRVASWPGREPEYVRRFCESLRLAGVHVQAIERLDEARSLNIDVLHIHWPEKVLWLGSPRKKLVNTLRALLTIVLLKRRGVTIVWCVHNIRPHDASRLLRVFWTLYIAALSRIIDGFITLAPSTIEVARRYVPALAAKPGTFIWHAPYAIPDAPKASREIEGRELRSSDTLLIFFGFPKRYKGVDALAECFSKIDRDDFYLGIFGSADEELSARLRDLAASDDRIILRLDWLSETELARTVMKSDVVVLPFKEILHSGSLIYALGCARPVVTPSGPYAVDIATQVGSDWIRLYEPPLTPEKLVKMSKRQSGRPNLEFLSLKASGEKLREFYLMLRQKRPLRVGRESRMSKDQARGLR